MRCSAIAGGLVLWTSVAEGTGVARPPALGIGEAVVQAARSARPQSVAAVERHRRVVWVRTPQRYPAGDRW